MISKGKLTGITMIVLGGIMALFSIYLVLAGALAKKVNLFSIIGGGLLFILNLVVLGFGIAVLASACHKIKYDNDKK